MTNIWPTRENRTARQKALFENRPIVNTDLVCDLETKIKFILLDSRRFIFF